VQGEVNLTADAQSAGLVARYSGPLNNNYYYAQLARVAPATFQASIFKVQGGVATQLGSQAAPSGSGTLRLEAVGPSLKLFLNNTRVAFGQGQCVRDRFGRNEDRNQRDARQLQRIGNRVGCRIAAVL
jgi:hypothetical protein